MTTTEDDIPHPRPASTPLILCVFDNHHTTSLSISVIGHHLSSIWLFLAISYRRHHTPPTPLKNYHTSMPTSQPYRLDAGDLSLYTDPLIRQSGFTRPYTAPTTCLVIIAPFLYTSSIIPSCFLRATFHASHIFHLHIALSSV